MIAGFYLDTTCSLTIPAWEYPLDDGAVGKYVQTCGYIIYGFSKSQGIFGVDLFTIPLGKSRVK